VKTIDVEIETTTTHYKSVSSPSFMPMPPMRRVDRIETNRYRMTVVIDNIVAVQEIENRQSRLWLKSGKEPLCINEHYASLLKRIREICKDGC